MFNPHCNPVRQSLFSWFLLVRQFVWHVEEFCTSQGSGREGSWAHGWLWSPFDPRGQSSDTREAISAEPWGPPDALRVHEPAGAPTAFLVSQLFIFLPALNVKCQSLALLRGAPGKPFPFPLGLLSQSKPWPLIGDVWRWSRFPRRAPLPEGCLAIPPDPVPAAPSHAPPSPASPRKHASSPSTRSWWPLSALLRDP